MGKMHGLREEYKNNGFMGIVKRLLYYVPNHYIIHKVKCASLAYGLNNTEHREKKIIVSMTSYPPRFNNIYLCLKSLLLQSMKPDKIIVWFGNDTTEADLTDGMRELQKYGIEYKFNTKENLKPHKKYFYVMQEFSEDIVITVDDDAVYPRNTIESLFKSYLRHPTAVSARRVHLMTFKDQQLEKYEKWKKEYRGEKKESYRLLAIGVGGVLYPPHILPKETFNSDAIKQSCFGADDIWLKCMEVLNGVKVVWVPCFFCHPPALAITTSLWQGNVNKNQNDEYILLVTKRYNINFNVK